MAAPSQDPNWRGEADVVTGRAPSTSPEESTRGGFGSDRNGTAQSVVLDDSAAKLAESLRAFVRAEVQSISNPVETPSRVSPSQVLWSGVIILDGILLASLIPLGWLEDARVKLLMDKVVPWMCASLAVAVYSAFQQQSKSVLSKPWFQSVAAGFALVLSLFAFPWVPLHPVLNPGNSLVQIDHGPAQATNSARWLRLAPHDLVISPDKSDSLQSGLGERALHLGIADLLAVVWKPRVWPLRRRVRFRSPKTKGLEIRIEPAAGELDPQFHQPLRLRDFVALESSSMWNIEVSGQTLTMRDRHPAEGTETFSVLLPLDEYRLTATLPDRNPWQRPLPVTAQEPGEPVELFSEKGK